MVGSGRQELEPIAPGLERPRDLRRHANRIARLHLKDLAVKLAWASVAGAALQFLVQVPVVRRLARGVRLVFENWPQGGQRLAGTPELWEAMFRAVPSPALGLCFDPSHLVWQGIDWRRALHEFGPRIYHAHAKDTEIVAEPSYRYGIYGAQLAANKGRRSGWYRYRLPGNGVVDWAAYVSALIEVGFDGLLSIEHEDDVYGWLDDPDLARRGLIAGLRFLQRYVV